MLVGEDALAGEIGEPPALLLVDAEEQGLVLGVEGERLAVVFAGAAGAPALALDAPAVDVVELARREDAGGVASEPAAQRLPVVEEPGPLRDHVAGSSPQRASRVFDRVAQGRIERGVDRKSTR